MKKSRFTEEQITFALRQADSGTPVAAQAVARRECTLEAPGGRSDPGSAHSVGGAQKKRPKAGTMASACAVDP